MGRFRASKALGQRREAHGANGGDSDENANDHDGYARTERPIRPIATTAITIRCTIKVYVPVQLAAHAAR